MIFQEEELQWRLLNIYAPHHASSRAQFLKDILRSLTVVGNWCIADKFNTLDELADWTTGSNVNPKMTNIALPNICRTTHCGAMIMRDATTTMT